MLSLLMVDDEPRTLDALESNVDWLTCGVGKLYKACSVERALEIMDAERIDLLLSDIEMPNASGLDLLSYIREKGCKIPCILLTCHAEYHYLRQAIQLGGTDYILKPVDYEELQSSIHKLAMGGAGPVTDRSETASTKSRDCDIERSVKGYVRNHMVDSITTNEIAAELHFHPKYLARAFKHKTGISITDYITKERIIASKKLLAETNLSIKTIGELVGYSDNAYFARVFKAETGHSPTGYRERRSTWLP